MRRLQMLLIAVLLTVGLPVFAAGLTVTQGVITTQVAGRAPVDALEVFPASVAKLFCFTRVEGAAGDTTITHVWYRGSEEMARIELPVRPGDWRTWSSKRLLPAWSGEWRVEVRDAAGNLLQTIPFTLQ
jgi:Protein of unknown function (DUF2914)